MADKLIAVIDWQGPGVFYLNFYNLSGELQNTYTLSDVYYETDCIAMDGNNNVYYIKDSNHLTKIDSGGNELLSVEIVTYPESIAMGADGYLYTRDCGGDNEIHKRSLTDFSSISHITLSGINYYGLVLDSDGNSYTVNWSTHKIEKWSSAGIMLASYDVSNYQSSSLGLYGNYLIRTADTGSGYSYIMHKDLDAAPSTFSLTNINSSKFGCGSLSDAYLFVGLNWTDPDYSLYLERYTAITLDWSIKVRDDGLDSWGALVAAYPFPIVAPTVTTQEVSEIYV